LRAHLRAIPIDQAILIDGELEFRVLREAFETHSKSYFRARMW